FLYQALWIHLDLSIGVVILLEHPAIFRQNVVNNITTPIDKSKCIHKAWYKKPTLCNKKTLHS
ncbi:hypothetical protein ACT4UT_03285, partial [Bacillus sp. B-TM1]